MLHKASNSNTLLCHLTCGRYELREGELSWCDIDAKDTSTVSRGYVSMASVLEIRFDCASPDLREICSHTFQVETSDRTFALGCETANEKVIIY